MAQFNITDVSAAMAQGNAQANQLNQFNQMQKIRPMEIAQLQAQQAQQQKDNQFKNIQQSNILQGQANQFADRDLAQEQAQKKQRELTKYQNLNVLKSLNKDQQGDYLKDRMKEFVEQGDEEGYNQALQGYNSWIADDGTFQDGIDQGIIQGQALGYIDTPKQAQGFTLKKGEQKFDAQGNIIASNQEAKQAPSALPESITEGVAPSVAQKAQDAYIAAGGGKDGLKAATIQIDAGEESEKRAGATAILQQTFPKANTEELKQLQGVMDGAKTVQEGLKAASVVRAEQQRLTKVKGFQERAVTLLDRILANPDTKDVVGSIEGSEEDNFFSIVSDAEADAIADITEVGDILTADNLKLMSGVLSETDIKILKNLAAGGLNRKVSEKRFMEDVNRIKAALTNVLKADTQGKASNEDQQKIYDKYGV